MSPKKQYYENLADSIIKKLNQRGMEGYYCDSGKDAAAMAKRFLTPGCTIAFGGSMTLGEIGLMDELSDCDYLIYKRPGPDSEISYQEYYSKAVCADFFFMSTNAITIDGQLVNIDGAGNRVALLIHGPSNVIVIAGMNKVESTLDAAIDRVHNMAAPPNCVRLNKNTPCAETGKCADCIGKDCICANTVITRKSMQQGRIKVILVGEELGY